MCVLAVVVAALLGSAPLPAPQANGIFELEHRWVVDAPVAGGAVGMWVATEALKKNFAPSSCRWCDAAADGTDRLNALDAWGRGLRAPLAGQHTADTWSNVVAFGLLPALVIGADLFLASGHKAWGAVPEDLVIMAEAAGLALLLDQGVKFAAGRERPFVHALPPDQKGLTAQPDDNNLSFFSGHSTLAFSLVAAAGTVAELRGYRYRALLWAIGVPLAVTVPLLRMTADKHYLTDVLVGSVVGAAFGVGVPLLFHPRTGRGDPSGVRVLLVPLPQGLTAVGAF